MNNRRNPKIKVNYFRVGMTVFLLVLIIVGIVFLVQSTAKDKKNNVHTGNDSSNVIQYESETTEPTTELAETVMSAVFFPLLTDNSTTFPSDYDSKYAVLIDTEKNEIIAYRNYNTRMYPASLTKVMTLIVAVENITDLSDTVTITEEMVNPMIDMQASRVGFEIGETPTLEQLLYGAVLPSGADASIALAEYVAGSEAAFVEMMNKKVEEMGLKNTHFTNVVGLHDENHYSTAEEIALILEYAIQNDLCRKILSTYQYEIPPTELSPDGILLTSTLFSRMDGTEMPGVIVNGGKTGYTDQAGNCLCSFAEVNGKEYILVFAGAISHWNVIYNTLTGYSVYCAGGEPYIPPTVNKAE